jgi:hypothetical protein
VYERLLGRGAQCHVQKQEKAHAACMENTPIIKQTMRPNPPPSASKQTSGLLKNITSGPPAQLKKNKIRPSPPCLKKQH